MFESYRERIIYENQNILEKKNENWKNQQKLNIKLKEMSTKFRRSFAFFFNFYRHIQPLIWTTLGGNQENFESAHIYFFSFKK